MESNGLYSLAKTTKKLFEYFFYYRDKGYLICDKILKLWGMFLRMNNTEYPFKVLINVTCQKYVLDSLNIFNIKNGPVLFSIFMEKTKQFKNMNKLDCDIRILLKDLAEKQF